MIRYRLLIAGDPDQAKTALFERAKALTGIVTVTSVLAAKTAGQTYLSVRFDLDDDKTVIPFLNKWEIKALTRPPYPLGGLLYCSAIRPTRR